jgi:poly-beta-1,6-N-acetyl-D-glucosamine N-deacetylase
MLRYWLFVFFLIASALAPAAAPTPAAAPAIAAAPTAALTVLSYHDVRDQVDARLDADREAISTRHLVDQFEWLRAQGYTPVSLEQLITARQGGKPLPEKAVMLTFDDGLVSAHTRVLPLLRAYGYPAVVAVVGRWLDLAPGESIDYAGRKLTRADFLSPVQLRELADSGLVDVVSHSYDLHRSITANPLGGQSPAATTREWTSEKGYESTTQLLQRLREDMRRSAAQIQALSGRAPRAMVWPYGAHSRAADRIAAEQGMPVAFSLGGLEQRGDSAVARLLLSANPDAGGLAAELRREPEWGRPVRAVQVDLDQVYDADAAQQARNLDALLERVRGLGVNQVWLQAYADPDGDGAADAVYFPNRHLPLRADLYSRVAWQLRTRASVDVYAWMPVLAFVLPDAQRQQRLAIGAAVHDGRSDPPRLDPFRAETRTLVGDLYEDLAAAGYMGGLLFGDDAVLRDDDQLAIGAPAPGRARTDALIAFTATLADRAAEWRPDLRTARNLFAAPVLDAAAEMHTAQALDRFVASYDQVAIMAMPELEGADDADVWLQELVHAAYAVADAPQRCVFELQARDWRRGEAIPTPLLTRRLLRLQQAGARHLSYYPDDFLRNAPALAPLRAVISASEHPYRRP